MKNHKRLYSGIVFSTGIVSLLCGWFIQYPIYPGDMDENHHLTETPTENGDAIGYINDFGLHHLASTGTSIKRSSSCLLSLRLVGDTFSESVIHFLTKENYQHHLYRLHPTDTLQAILTQQEEKVSQGSKTETKPEAGEKSCPT